MPIPSNPLAPTHMKARRILLPVWTVEYALPLTPLRVGRHDEAPICFVWHVQLRLLGEENAFLYVTTALYLSAASDQRTLVSFSAEKEISALSQAIASLSLDEACRCMEALHDEGMRALDQVCEQATRPADIDNDEKRTLIHAETDDQRRSI